MPDTYLIQRLAQLLELGYRPTPNKGKACKFPGWNKPGYLEDVLTTGPKGSPLERWPNRFSDHLTLGLRIDRGLLVIDADVDDELVDRLIAFIATIAPDVVARAPTRFGGGTWKLALFLRTNASPEEVDKIRGRISSARYRRESDDVDTHHVVEIFLSSPADEVCRRQFGIYGAHTIDVKDYQWCEDVPALHEVAPADLPVLSVAQAWEIVAAFERLADEAGWERLGLEQGAANAALMFTIDEDTRFDLQDGSTVDYAGLCATYLPGMDLRCSSSFHDGIGSNRSKCRVGEVLMLGGRIGVWDNED